MAAETGGAALVPSEFRDSGRIALATLSTHSSKPCALRYRRFYNRQLWSVVAEVRAQVPQGRVGPTGRGTWASVG